jgi:glycosyltransferase involved in cell wall biosynthesis
MHDSAVPVFSGIEDLSRTRASVLVCFSHLRWDFVYQRPQHLLSRAAAEHQVYFFEEPIFEHSGVLPRLDLCPQPGGVIVAVPVLAEGAGATEASDQMRLMLDELLAGRAGAEIIFWYYTPMALQFSDHIEPDLCVYDCMDELSAFRGAPAGLRLLERRLFQRSDLVFTGGQSLFEAKRDKHPNVYAFPSSIDKNHFMKARRILPHLEPADQACLGRPRIGFFGVIDERMDLDLVDRVAMIRPNWEFVLVGPIVKVDPQSLPRRANIHWLGTKDYKDLPSYLGHWDAGFMPFALNESTRFISPTKTPEFLAAGVPVVSTPIRDVVRPYGKLGLVAIAREPEQVVAQIYSVLARERGPWLATVDRYLADFSWDRTWAAMSGLMREKAERRAGAAHEPHLTRREAAESVSRV